MAWPLVQVPPHWFKAISSERSFLCAFGRASGYVRLWFGGGHQTWPPAVKPEAAGGMVPSSQHVATALIFESSKEHWIPWLVTSMRERTIQLGISPRQNPRHCHGFFHQDDDSMTAWLRTFTGLSNKFCILSLSIYHAYSWLLSPWVFEILHLLKYPKQMSAVRAC